MDNNNDDPFDLGYPDLSPEDDSDSEERRLERLSEIDDIGRGRSLADSPRTVVRICDTCDRPYAISFEASEMSQTRCCSECFAAELKLSKSQVPHCGEDLRAAQDILKGS